MVERVLERERDAGAGPQGDADPHCEGRGAAVQRMDVVLELRPDHREVGERGVEHAALQIGIALERVAEQRHEHEEQREDREERVIGDARGEVAALVLGELLPHRERKCQRAVALLQAVEPRDDAGEGAHGAVVPVPRDSTQAWPRPLARGAATYAAR